MPFVYSTLTNSTIYAIYRDTDPKASDIIERKILIKGGANIANKHFETPTGVVTEVSDDDLKLLMKDYHFREHMKNGFVTVENYKASPEKVAKNMEEKDPSAPRDKNSEEFAKTKPMNDGDEIVDGTTGNKNRKGK